MRVWIENPFDTLPFEGGRPQRYYLMSEAFARAGHRVVCWTADFNHMLKRRRVFDAAVLEKLPFAVETVPTRPYSRNVGLARVLSHRAYAREWGRLAEAYAKWHGRPDVIVISTPPLSTGDVAIRLARKFGAKLVVDVMDAWPQTFYRLLPFGFRWLKGVLFSSARAAARRQLRSADLVTGVAERYGRLARAAGASRFHLAYHGIDLAAAPLPAARSAASAALRLAYVGSMGRTYDLETVVETVARMPEVKLTLAGGGEKRPELERLASELGCASRVRFLGYLDEVGLTSLLSESDVGVVPMDADSFVGVPYKFGDYSRAGLAIVSSLAGESAAMLQRYGAGLRYLGGNADDLVSALRRLRPRLDAARSASRRMAEEEFDAEKIYSEYVRTVERLREEG